MLSALCAFLFEGDSLYELADNEADDDLHALEPPEPDVIDAVAAVHQCIIASRLATVFGHYTSTVTVLESAGFSGLRAIRHATSSVLL